MCVGFVLLITLPSHAWSWQRFPAPCVACAFPDFCLWLEPRARSDPRTHGDAHTRTQRTPVDTQTCTRTLTRVCRRNLRSHTHVRAEAQTWARMHTPAHTQTLTLLRPPR